jgi:hypothetical protein
MVMNMNEAGVSNRIEVRSATGENWAGGSYGGNGGDGGDIRNGEFNLVRVNGGNDCDQGNDGDVEDSTTGNGGSGGAASAGGAVMSGNASAVANVSNTANSNRTLIDRCACVEEDECDCGRDAVISFNRLGLANDGNVRAYTGENDAEGSYGGEGGQGGDIGNSGDGDIEESMTGTGGNGNAGGEGGLVQTGQSNSRLELVNVFNRNITRVLR